MKLFPKLKRRVPDSIVRETSTAFAILSAEVHVRLRTVKPVEDDRKGFGTVYTSRDHGLGNFRQSAWNWNHTRAGNYNADLGANHFVDDPLGADATDSLAARMRVATVFADAANSLFAKTGVIAFVARPLEVASSADGRAPGIYPGVEGDLLVIDLLLDMPRPKVVERLVRDYFEREHARGYLTDIYDLQPAIWQDIARLNAARAMLAPSSRALRFPARPSLKRHLVALQDKFCVPNKL